MQEGGIPAAAGIDRRAAYLEAAPAPGPAPQPALQARLDHHEHQRQHDEDRDDGLEGALGQVEEQRGPDDAAHHRGREQQRQAPALAAQLAPVAPRTRHPAGHEADGVADGGRQRRVPQGHERGEGDEGAGPDDGVDGAGPQARDEDQGHLEPGHVR